MGRGGGDGLRKTENGGKKKTGLSGKTTHRETTAGTERPRETREERRKTSENCHLPVEPGQLRLHK